MLTADHPDLTEADAYRVQEALVGRHLAAGATRTGWKLGLTSRAKQREMGIDVPIVGVLLDTLVLVPGTPLDLAELGQPRAEPEIAFLIGRDLAGADGTEAQVLASTDGVAAALEVLDSRYDGYRFTLANASKDIGYYAELAAKLGCATQLTDSVAEIFAKAVETGHGGRNVSHLLDPAIDDVT